MKNVKTFLYRAGLISLLLMPTCLQGETCSYGTLSGNFSGRKLNSFTLSDGTHSAQVTVNQGDTRGSAVYFDKTSETPLQIQAGTQLYFSDIDWSGEWMHCYLFIDYNKDDSYNTTVNPYGTNSGELVAYSFYSSNGTATGVNSLGESRQENNGVSASVMPNFTLPENLNPGEYKCLFKVDWNDITPCGSTQIGTSHGAAVEFNIEIVGVVDRTVTISSADNSKGTVAFKDYPDVLKITVGGPVTIVATPTEGHTFVNWTVDNSELSTLPEFTVTGNDDITIVGNFISYEDAGIIPAIRGDNIIQLSELNGIEKITCLDDQGVAVRANRSAIDNPITIMGDIYESGVGTHAPSIAYIELNGATSFHAVLGVDDEVLDKKDNTNEGIVDYIVTLYGDVKSDSTVICSGTLSIKESVYKYEVNIEPETLTQYKYLKLEYSAGTQPWSDHADWADARFEFEGTVPRFVTTSEMYDGVTIQQSLLASATTLFSQPGVKFMHKLRSNEANASFNVKDLPEGLTFNSSRNLIEGIIEQPGDYYYTVVTSIASGVNEIRVDLKVSSELQQPTPFMGWLSWNVIEGNISNQVVRDVADAMESKGLKDAGYNYLVIDDLWHASSRNTDNTPKEDPTKFPDGMKAAADYAHSKGLKFGIYSDAAENTCANAYGSFGYETIDAQKYAEWGVDLLKYDYCHAPTDETTAKARYQTMGDALKQTGRNIVLYICEWGVREPWKWGAEVGGTCWRATYDTRDCWNGIEASNGIGVLQSIKNMKDLWAYNGVNRWNDADMMCVGIHGTGKSSSDLCATGPGMTQDEYATQFALWCMWSSPLTLSFDVREEISEEDMAIMTNSELIALDQDRMGQAAELIYEDAYIIVFAKDLENGDVAVSVTNLSPTARNYNIDFNTIPALNSSDSYYVRDVVNHQDLEPVSNGTINCSNIPSHATVVYRLSKNSPVRFEWVSTTLQASEVTHNSAKVEIMYTVENLPEEHTIGAEAVLKDDDSVVKFPLTVSSNPHSHTLEFTGLTPDTRYEYDIYLHRYNNDVKVGGTTGDVQSLPVVINTLDETTMIDDVLADQITTGARYYNLNGVQVDNPTTGVYIRIQGGKATKVYVK